MSLAVYILNDLRDIEKDRKHLIKENRPIVNGKIKKKSAVAMCITCLVGGQLLF